LLETKANNGFSEANFSNFVKDGLRNVNKKLLMINIASTLAIMLLFIGFGIQFSMAEDYSYTEHQAVVCSSNKAVLNQSDFSLQWIADNPITRESEGNTFNITYSWQNPFSFVVQTVVDATMFYHNGTYINGVEFKGNSKTVTINPQENITILFNDVTQWYILDYLCGNPNRGSIDVEAVIANALSKLQFTFTFPQSEWQTVLAKYPNSVKTSIGTVTEKTDLGYHFHLESFIPYLIDGLLFCGFAVLFEWSFVKKKLGKILLLNFVASLIVCGLAGLLMWLGYYLPYAIGSPIGNFAWLTLGIIFYGLGFWGMIIITSILTAFIFCMAFTVAIWIAYKILKKTDYWFKKD